MAATAAESGLVGLPTRRVVAWALGLIGIGLAPLVAAPLYGFQDWPDFWSAGMTAGTADLVPYDRLLDWQQAHGVVPNWWPYPPAAALVLSPIARAGLAVSFWIHAALMLMAAVGAGTVGARTFGLTRRWGVLAVLAWAPVTAGIVAGQNAPLGLLLALLAIEATFRGHQGRAGVAVALLLYKPTLALPVAGMFIVRHQWRSAAIVAASLVPWYVVGIIGAGGDTGWPLLWLDGLVRWLAGDVVWNADKATSLPGLVLGTPLAPFALASSFVLVVLAWPRLRRAPVREAMAAACLVGVAASPHALAWDAALGAPLLLWALGGGVAEPARTRAILAAYLLAPFWIVSRQTGASVLAVVILMGVALWLRSPEAPGPEPRVRQELEAAA